MNRRSTIAIFDFDGTLTKHDTFFPFLIHCFGVKSFIKGIILNSPYLVLYFFKLYPNYKAKQKLIRFFFSKKDINQMKKCANSFVKDKMKNNIRKGAIKRFLWHKKMGHTTILISASLELYISIWGGEYGFDYVEGTKLKLFKSKYTGEINGLNCYGTEKVTRLKKIFGEDFSNNLTYGYGDGSGDRFFLEKCNVVHTKKEIQRLKS